MKMQEFSIKELESFTGIKAHTIRIWEQRYGLLAPDRTDTNIRKYTDRDLKFLLNVSLLSNLGYKISQIAQMSEDELKEAVARKATGEHSENHFLHVLKISMLNYDEDLFNSVVEPYIELHGLEKTFREMMMPFLRQIGILWQASVICPAQEHFISALIRQKIHARIDTLKPADKKVGPPIILYLPELEIHELSLLMMFYILKLRGWKSVYLGPSVPMDDLIQVYQRLGTVNFVSIYTTNPSTVLLNDHFKKLSNLFQDTDCQFYLTGNNLKGLRSPDSTLFHFFNSADDLLKEMS
jgi:DNA-binding transcriptional MerR regulator